MIPYDDLVVALAAWRARQGLPVAQVAVAPPPPAPRAPAPASKRATAPRAAPPPPPPPPSPPPAPTSSSSDDFEDGGLVEDGQYASAGDDYVVPLGGDMVEQLGESTAIGDAPEPPSEGLTKRGKRNPDW